MTKLRWIGRIFGYGVPIVFMLVFVIANEIHWPQVLLVSNDLTFWFTMLLFSVPLLCVYILDIIYPSKSDPSPDSSKAVFS